MLNIASIRVPHKLAEKFNKGECGLLSKQMMDFKNKYKHSDSPTQGNMELTNSNGKCDDNVTQPNNLLDRELNTEDIWQLINSEEELANRGHYERIFPTKNADKYLKYFSKKRYFNELLNDWETRYANQREIGIEYLNELIKNKEV